MTVPTTVISSPPYAGNDVATAFPTAFMFLDADQVVPVLIDGDGETDLVSGFVVTGTGVQTGGTVTLSVPLATGKSLRIDRRTALTQPESIRNLGSFAPKIHEQAWNRLLMQIQESEAGTLRVPRSSLATFDGTLPPPGPLLPLVGKADGTGYENGSTTLTGDMLLRPNLAADSGASLVAYKQAGVGATAQLVSDKFNELPSVLDYLPRSERAAIKAGTSTYDCTAGFNAALTAHNNVSIPAGRYTILGQVVVGNNKHLIGAGRRCTTIYIPNTASLAVSAYFLFSVGQPGPTLSDFAISFQQPDSAIIGDYTQYPPAIRGANTTRWTVARMRIELAWDGINMTGNPGGAIIEDLELSMFNKGIIIDGALDSIKISKLHLWVFSGTTSMTANQRAFYTVAYGLHCGRCDDLHISDSIFFSMINAAYFYAGTGGSVFGNITNCDFDDRGGLVVDSGALQLSGCFFSMGQTDSQLVKVSAGVVAMAACRLKSSVATTLAAVELTGAGVLTFAACIFTRGSVNQTFFKGNASGGQMTINASSLSQDVVSFTTPYVDAGAGTSLVFTDNQAGPRGAGTSVLVDADGGVPTVITGNNFNGNSIALPVAFTSQVEVHSNLTVGLSGAEEITGAYIPGGFHRIMLAGTLDGAGAATVAHGVGNASNRVLSAQAWYKDGSSNMVPCAIATIGNTNIALTGGGASRPYRIVLESTRANHAW